MISREKISGKVELGLNYELLLRDSDIYPRDFDHFSWIFVSDSGFGGGIIIRVEGSFLR